MIQTCVDTGKKKLCIDCGKLYFPYLKNQELCGSLKYKRGCYWKSVSFKNNEKAKKRYHDREESYAKVKLLEKRLSVWGDALEDINYIMNSYPVTILHIELGHTLLVSARDIRKIQKILLAAFNETDGEEDGK